MYLMTHSLLSSWLYSFEDLGERDAYDEFLSVLRRERREPTEAMIRGREFENQVMGCIGRPHEYQPPITDIAVILQGATPQLKASKLATIAGVDLLLYGVLDFLRGGVIYDTKYTSHYEVGKYRNSTQHPMYFELIPDAEQFEYIACNGRSFWQESYRRDETPPITDIVTQFLTWLDGRPDCKQLYMQHWRARS